MSVKIISIFLLIMFITMPLFAGLPNQAQLNKYCIQAKMTIDGGIHNFVASNIVDFTDNGFTVLWGKYRENRANYLREQFLNYNEIKEKYEKLKKEFNL